MVLQWTGSLYHSKCARPTCCPLPHIQSSTPQPLGAGVTSDNTVSLRAQATDTHGRAHAIHSNTHTGLCTPLLAGHHSNHAPSCQSPRPPPRPHVTKTLDIVPSATVQLWDIPSPPVSSRETHPSKPRGVSAVPNPLKGPQTQCPPFLLPMHTCTRPITPLVAHDRRMAAPRHTQSSASTPIRLLLAVHFKKCPAHKLHDFIMTSSMLWGSACQLPMRVFLYPQYSHAGQSTATSNNPHTSNAAVGQ